jgi:putative transposase
LVGIGRSTYRYQSQASTENEEIKNRLTELALTWRRFGYRRLHVLMQREGWQVNHKRIYRLYRNAGLSVRRRKRKRVWVYCKTKIPFVVQALPMCSVLHVFLFI